MIGCSGRMTTSECMTCLVDRDICNDLIRKARCHGFTGGKLLVASYLHCVNCRLNPNHKPCHLTLCPKPVVPNMWHMYLRGTFAYLKRCIYCTTATN